MAVVKLDFQAEVDILNKNELDQSLAAAHKSAFQSAIAGIKYMRIPRLVGQVSSNAIQLGAGPIVCGPASGFAWSIRRLLVNGLTAGATPDVVNIYRNGIGSDPVWQFNGNSFGGTFGRLELVLLPNESLWVANVGSIAATGQITLTGEAVEVPAERMGALA